jgi:hypothetical protein
MGEYSLPIKKEYVESDDKRKFIKKRNFVQTNRCSLSVIRKVEKRVYQC